eukprot:tig00020556_g10984.t1
MLAFGLPPAGPPTVEFRRGDRELSWRSSIPRTLKAGACEPDPPAFEVVAMAGGRRRTVKRQAPTFVTEDIDFNCARSLEFHLAEQIQGAREAAAQYRSSAARVLLNDRFASLAAAPRYCRTTSGYRKRAKPVTVISINSCWRTSRARRLLEDLYKARASSESYRLRLSEFVNALQARAGHEEVTQLSILRSWDSFEMSKDAGVGLVGLSEWENIHEKLADFALVQLAAEGRMRFYMEEVVGLERAEREAKRAQVNARLAKIFFDMPPASISPEPTEESAAAAAEAAASSSASAAELPEPAPKGAPQLPDEAPSRRSRRQPGVPNTPLPARWVPAPFTLVNLVIAVPSKGLQLTHPDVAQLPDEVCWRRSDGRSRAWSYRLQREILGDIGSIASHPEAWVSFSVWDADAASMHDTDFWRS